MSRKRSNAFAEFVTGVFMLVVLALLAYFTIVISGVDLIRGRERVKRGEGTVGQVGRGW